jgi:protein-L-isoaspartate(D-aspartate) O-methyltransferase
MGQNSAIQRQKMVDGQLITTGITDKAVMAAMLSVPREAFLPSDKRPFAHIDEDIEIGDGRYLMEPSPFAKLLQLAKIGPDAIVLDIGAASGYSSAVLSRIAASVIAVDESEALVTQASDKLVELGFDNVAVIQARHDEGCAAEAPYDAIIIEGAVADVPAALLSQLKDGGKLVAVIGVGNAASAWLYIKEDGRISKRRAFNCAVKSLPGLPVEETFEF